MTDGQLMQNPDGEICRVIDPTRDESGIYPVPEDYWTPTDELPAESQSTWSLEFGREWAVPDEILELTRRFPAFKDLSWHDDACPSFGARLPVSEDEHDIYLTIWVDHPDPGRSEVPRPEGADRYDRFQIVVGEYGDPNVVEIPVSDPKRAAAVAEWLYRMIVTAHHDLQEVIRRPPHPLSPITDFASVHEQVDANMLGEADECMKALEPFDTPERQGVGGLAIQVINMTQEVLNRWLIEWRQASPTFTGD